MSEFPRIKEVKMYCSVIDIEIQPGKFEQAKAQATAMLPEYQKLGCKQFILVDRGNDSFTVIAIYESQAKQEEATPKAQELLGTLAEMMKTPPERKGAEIIINEVYG